MELAYNGSGKAKFKDELYEFDLYINEDYGSVFININIMKEFCSFIELPLTIESLFCEFDYGFKFILLNCHRKRTEDIVSQNKTVFSYIAQYMIKGILDDTKDIIRFNSIQFSVLDIIEWGGISGYKLDSENKITYNYNTETILYDEQFTIKYIVDNSSLPCISQELLKNNINLNQTGIIEITTKKQSEELSFFIEVFLKIKKLIELSTSKNVGLNRITGFSDEIKDVLYDDVKIHRPIEIVGGFYKNTKNHYDMLTVRRFITLSELLDVNGFEAFLRKYDLLIPIIDLYIEIIYAQQISVVRVFLNIVQALETYHSRFVTNKLSKFKSRIEKVILANCDIVNKDYYRLFLIANSKNFITLESRLADLLLAEFKISFDTGDITQTDFPNVIAKTRNYYIHYDEKIKTDFRVLTPEELSIYNNALLHILDYYILLELGFENIKELQKKLNDRWGEISTTLSIIKESNKKHNSPK